MAERLYTKGKEEEIVDELVIDKTLGMLVRKSSQFERINNEVTSGIGNLTGHSN